MAEVSEKPGAAERLERKQLLESLTIPGLLDVAFTAELTALLDQPEKTKAALLKALSENPDQKTVLKAAHRVETILPFKHVYLFALANASSFDQCVEKIKAVNEEQLNSYVPLDYKLYELQFQTCLLDFEQQRVILKLTHVFDYAEWKEIEEETWKRVKQKRRHPIVVTLRFDQRVVTVAFPGFTQGNAVNKNQRVSYEDTVARVRDYLGFGEGLDIQLEDISLKNGIENLIENHPDEVMDFGRYLRPAEGGSMLIRPGECGADVKSYLANFFGSGITEEQIANILRSTEADEVVLLWKRLDVLTKISFRHSHPNFLFIWRKTGAGSSIVEHVLRLVLFSHRTAGNPRFAEAVESINQTPVGQVIRASSLMQLFSLSAAESMNILQEALTKGKVQLQFRARTDALLHEFENNWRSRLEEFPLSVTDEHGHTLRLDNAENIEIGFKRINA